MEKRNRVEQRRSEFRRSQDEQYAKALNDLLEAVRKACAQCPDVETREQLGAALANFAIRR